MRRAIPLVTLLMAAMVSGFHAQTTGADELIKIDSNLVVLPVTITDKKGRTVLGLKKDDLRVLEDGIEQKIEFFNSEPLPVSWVLVLDRSESMSEMQRDVYRAALHVIDNGTSNDEMAIVTFNEKVNLVSGFERDKHRLENAVTGIRADGTTALYDAVDFALGQLRGAVHRKKVLVVVTDGEDNASKMSLATLITRAEEEDLTIYTVGMFDSMMSRKVRLYQDELEKLAAATGGRAHFPRNLNECQEVMSQIALEIKEHYNLAYYPSNTSFDGRWRRITVQFTQPDRAKEHILRTRPGYYANQKGRH